MTTPHAHTRIQSNSFILVIYLIGRSRGTLTAPKKSHTSPQVKSRLKCHPCMRLRS